MRAVLFDFSGTLASLEGDDSWFGGMGLDERARAAVVERLTHPTAAVDHAAWAHRDLDPASHRVAYLHALRECGLPEEHAESLYRRCVDPAQWRLYPDAAPVLDGLRAAGVRTAVVSNIAWDVRAVLAAGAAEADEYVLSYQVGAAKPDSRIFEAALARLGVEAGEALMVGDSPENDGAAAALGCGFALVDPLPVARRPAGLIDALRGHGLAV